MLSPGRALCSGWWSPLQVGADCSVHDRPFSPAVTFAHLSVVGHPTPLQRLAPLGEACSRIIAGSREPQEHPCLEAGWRALASRAGGGWDDGNWEAWDRTEVHWLSGLGSGQGGPRGETRKPMVQGGTWAPWALFQAGSSGSSTGGSAPPGTA